ncbi:reactive intermediate/imine deaminase [Aerococcus urinaehominis]|uniref:Reactive intermediate/imine deaminase n=1 Tax=Aerococcus urinaehominis TaxID=128944 RepID=A0A120IAT9_9LACT|nr:RidA family protein [Aerococcus urinaehominis]AMB99116.1 reactive intermediate/imine deaminase [Aerococcus urinaehominis]SDM04206.1 2-iminobutanoate/2-iminopropanoate deaminase [Aerococcus urinaehominis]
MKKAIHTDQAPQAVGPYSQAIQIGDVTYASGQLGLVPETGQLAEGLEEQTKQAFANIKAVLAAAGLAMDDIVKVTVLLADINDFEAVNTIYADQFSQPYPARSAFAVKDLPKGGLVEIEVIAVKSDN